MKDVKLDDIEDEGAFCPCATKFEDGGFSCKIPGWIRPSFQLHMSQFSPKTKDDSKLLKNFSVKPITRSHTHGTSKAKALAKNAATECDMA